MTGILFVIGFFIAAHYFFKWLDKDRFIGKGW